MKLLYTLLFLIILLQACTPQPVFRLTPQAANTTFNQGTEYVHIKDGGIELTMSYYRHLGDRFVMDVEIVNATDSVLRVDPIQFSYEAYKFTSFQTPWDTNNVIASARAVNPEVELLEKDMAISRSVANQKTNTLLYAVGQAAYVGASIAADTEEEREELEEDSNESYYRYRADQLDYELERDGLRDQRRVWELETLRKTDLYPDEYIRGYLFFNNNPDARGYEFHFTIKDKIFRVFYEQLRYEVQ